jgi:signal transduction histidine kinase
VFKTLQARLTVSYIVIIVACLMLVGLSALLLLRGHQRTLMYDRLRDRATLASGFTAQMLSRSDTPQEVVDRLAQQLGDADHLGRVFDNLLDNALKHSRDVPDGGWVILRADWQDGNVVRSVTDNGPGIPADDLPRVFERFYQVDKSRVRRGSAGLGLSIAQEIVSAHGGHIRAESVEGLGTRIIVELPAERT